MKKLKRTAWMLTMALTATALFTACDDDDTYVYCIDPVDHPNALVTVKPQDNGSTFYMQLDEKTTLHPVNMTASPYGEKEVRALVKCYLKGEQSEENRKNVFVVWMDSILTKPCAENLGTEELNYTAYGNDPVEIVNDWVTIAEDGYLTLRFRTYWSNRNIPHHVNLVASNDPEKPYEVTFYHDAKGDGKGYVGDGIVAFRLSDLPDTNGETVDLTLRWNSFSGEKSHTFKYCTRKATGSDEDIAAGTYMKMLK